MGTEFFNRNKGAIHKAREKQKAKLASELPPIVYESSVMNFNTWTGKSFSHDQKFEVCIENETVTAFHDRTPVGFIKDASGTKLFQEIKEAGGRAVGTYDRFLKRSAQLSLVITIPKNGGSLEQNRQLGSSIR